MRLLPRDLLVKTSELDQAAWNYQPLLGALQRQRFRMTLSLLDGVRYPRLLEIGYGSGVFMPELAVRCDELYGVDVHERTHEVSSALSKCKVEARLFCGSATQLPFEDAYFDCIIAVSVLEFVDAPERALAEIARVLKPPGSVIAIVPGKSVLIDCGLKVLTATNARTHYGDRRERIVAEMKRRFVLVKEDGFPLHSPYSLRLYRGLKFRPR